MIIYHGSEKRVEKPLFGYGKKENDYGQGFYTTEIMELAKEWSASGIRDGYLNTYDLCMDGLRILDLNDDHWNILNWLSVLAEHRVFDIPLNRKSNFDYLIDNFHVDISSYDLIRGYRADDSYFSMAKAFIRNDITLSQLKKGMYLGELGIQWCLKSEKAFSQISFISAEQVPLSEYRPRKVLRDDKARSAFRNGIVVEDDSEILMADIRREGMKQDDPRLQ